MIAADFSPVPGFWDSVQALYRSAGDVGFLAAPPLLGMLSEATSISTALHVSGALVILSAVVFAIGSRGDAAAGTGSVARA